MINTINCENCGHDMDIEQSLYKQIYGEVSSDLNSKDNSLKQREISLAEDRKKLDEEAKLHNIKVNEAVAKRESELQEEWTKSQIQRDKSIKDDIRKEYEDSFKNQEIEANKKANENTLLITENMKLAAQIESINETQKSQANMREAEIRAEEKRKANEEKEMISKSNAVQMEQMKNEITSLQQKIEQGSMQVQGEAQEAIIEDFLKFNFRDDIIEPVKQGALGADCIQHVRTNTNIECGSILYESKNTKDFQPAWIEKLKGDMRAKGISIAVLATKAMPKDMERAGFINNIYVCPLDGFKTISAVLRKQLLQINQIRSIGENRQDIATHLYKYLTSSEFRMDMEAIVEGFTEMKSDIDSEKRAQARQWKKREKHLEKIMLSTANMYGSLQGIAGNSIETIKGLDFPGEFEQIEEIEEK